MNKVVDDAGIGDFLARYSALRATVDQGRLAYILEQIREVRHHERAKVKPPIREVDPARITALLPHLKAALQERKTDGHLLNVWAVAGLRRNEVRTTAVLGWVLDCHGSHGFGSRVLNALLARLRQHDHQGFLDGLLIGEDYRIDLEHCAFGARDNRIDIAIEGENCVLFIEVKIDAPVGEDQLERYQTVARSKATALKKPFARVIYLTLWPPASTPADVICLRWKEVAAAVRDAVRSSDRKSHAAAILLQYADHVGRL